MNPVQAALEDSLARLRDQADPGLPEEEAPELVEYGRYAGEVVDGHKTKLGNRWEPTWWVHDIDSGVWRLVEYQYVDGAVRMVCGCPEGQAVVEAFEDDRPVDSCWHLRAVMEELHRRQAPSRNRPSAPVNSGLYE